MRIRTKKLNKDAVLPQYQTKGAAGFDLHSVEEVMLYPGETKVIKTGLAVEIPEGYEMQIRSRSGLAAKNQVFVLNSPGTIDSDYRGEIGIILSNGGWHVLHVKIGDRIAQGVMCEVPQAYFIEVEELSNTARGEGGFGSTNK